MKEPFPSPKEKRCTSSRKTKAMGGPASGGARTKRAMSPLRTSKSIWTKMPKVLRLIFNTT